MKDDMPTTPRDSSDLCYVDAARIAGPLAAFDSADVLSGRDQKIGTFDGILLDAARRQVQYLVVKTGRLLQRRYLVPLDQTRIDTHRQALRVDVDRETLANCDRFDPEAFRPFSDDDLLAALFARDYAA